MYKRSNTGIRIFLLLLMVIALIFGGSIWFDYLGLIDAKALYSPLFNLIGIGTPKPVEDPQSLVLLDEERFLKQQEGLILRDQELDKREAAIQESEIKLQETAAELTEREDILEEREKAFNQILKEYDNKIAALRETANQLNNMAPEQAVSILNEYQDEQLLVDTLRMSEKLSVEGGKPSNVAYWLTLMSKPRAARIQEIMVKKPDA